MRFDSLARRAEGEHAYSVSDAWRLVPRAAILALIENYTEIVLELDENTLQGLRQVSDRN